MRGILEKFNPWQEKAAIQRQVESQIEQDAPEIERDFDISPEDELAQLTEERKQAHAKSQQERQKALENLRQKRTDRWQQYHQERKATPDPLEDKDFLDKEGKEVNFSQAQNWDDLVEMIRSQKSITNNNNLELPPEKVINMMYKLAYQHFDNFDKTDWTNITLRHGLRQAVAEHIYKYQQTAEFQGLKGLDLSGVNDMEDLFSMLRSHKVTAEAQIIGFDAEKYIENIQSGRLDLLPDPIKNKVIEINNHQKAEEKKQEGLMQKVSKGFGKLAFWRK